MVVNNIRIVFIVFISLLSLIACGGGSGGGSSTEANQQPLVEEVVPDNTDQVEEQTNDTDVLLDPSAAVIDFAVTSRLPLYEPAGDQTLLIVGQDLAALGDVTDGTTVYADGYLNDDQLDDLPVGLTTYLQIQDNQGLTTTFDNLGEIKNAELTVNHRDFSDTTPLLTIGYFLGNDYAGIVNGVYDDALMIQAMWIQDKDVPTFLRIGYEFNAEWTGHASNPTEYINAFRYIVSFFERAGVTNCAFVWQSDGNGTAEQLRAFYPGDDYVDWLAYSHFEAFGEGMIELAVELDKPVMIAEATPVNHDLNQAADAGGQQAWDSWFEPLFSHIDNNEVIRMLAYINVDWPSKAMWQTGYFSTTDARIQQSPIVKTHWINEMTDGTWFSSVDALSAIGYIPTETE